MLSVFLIKMYIMFSFCIKKIMEDPEPEDLLHAEHISEISSQSEFVPSAELSHR